MAAIQEEFPLLRFYFRVEINGVIISFQEVTGLEMEVESIPYRLGNSEDLFPIQIPGMVKFPILVCKRGILKDDMQLVEFMTKMITKREYYLPKDKLTISVELLNHKKETVMNWSIFGAFPKKLSTPGFNSVANEIAIEEMEFTYDSMTISKNGS